MGGAYMQKLLILQPQDICYGVLDDFARNLGAKLTKLGAAVEYFDVKKEDPQRLGGFLQDTYDAVIDFYSGLLSVEWSDGTNLWNRIGAPVFQVCYDFPVNIMDILGTQLTNYYALCADDYYREVFRVVIPQIKDTFFYLPAGEEGMNSEEAANSEETEREMDIVFIGTYSDYRSVLSILENCEDDVKRIGAAFFKTMIEHVHCNQIDAFEMVLDKLQITLPQETFYGWLQSIGQIALAAMAYQRERMVRTVLDAGLELHVYGDSWKHSPFAECENLIIHDKVCGKEYLEVLKRAKISLNLTYCNKKNCTERVFHSMLNGAVVVGDNTSEYIRENFKDQEEMVLFDFADLAQLPEKLTELLMDSDKREKIAANAKRTALESHTWECRAKEFLEILRTVTMQGGTSCISNT